MPVMLIIHGADGYFWEEQSLIGGILGIADVHHANQDTVRDGIAALNRNILLIRSRGFGLPKRTNQ